MKMKLRNVKRIISLLLVMVMVCTPMPSVAYATNLGDEQVEGITLTQPANGEGTINNPYLLSTKEHLYWFANEVNVEKRDTICAKLTDNITVNGSVLKQDGSLTDAITDLKQWTPIGTEEYRYKGTFDGNNHSISGLYVDSENAQVGLFGVSGTNGSIKNVTVQDSYWKGLNGAGGICGGNYGTITNCTSNSTVNTEHDYAGGICGYNEGAITNCASTGMFNAEAYAGGISGYNRGAITNCASNSTVNVEQYYAGGICGYNFGIITNCYYLTGDGIPEEAVGENNGKLDADTVKGKTFAQYKSGEVCYLLNEERTEGREWAPLMWYQNLTTDEFPVLQSTGTNTVYPKKAQNCRGKADNSGYTNNKEEMNRPEHRYQNGFCSECGELDSEYMKKTEGVYEISTKEQLYWFAARVNCGDTTINAKLTDNITVNGSVLKGDGSLTDAITDLKQWTPIGTEEYRYNGTFDGNNHSISGLYVDSENGFGGLFGVSDTDAYIKNVAVQDYYCNELYFIGGICGYNNGTIIGCTSSGTVNSEEYAGGICGCNGGTIIGCTSSGTINSEEDAGGICSSNDGTITSCTSSGMANAEYAGGICSSNYGTITNCYYLTRDGKPEKAIDRDKGTLDADTVQGKTLEVYKSGEVCYLLNGKRSEGTKENPIMWYQNLRGCSEVDNFPVLDSTHVIIAYDQESASYTNGTTDRITLLDHGAMQKECTGQPQALLTGRGQVFKWNGTTEEATLCYYVKIDTCYEKTTEANSGSEREGGAPAKPGTYYVQVTIAENDHFAETTSDYYEYCIIICEHRNTELRNVKEATYTEKGYTGDLCCTNCGTIMEKGTETALLLKQAPPASPETLASPAPPAPDKIYQLAYNLNKGINSKENPASYHADETVTLQNPSRKGYAFKGWFTDSSYKNKIASISKGSNSNYNLYAKWSKVKVSKVKALRLIKKKGKKLLIKYKKLKGVSGYEITYATNAKFKKNKKMTRTTKASKVIKRQSKKKYYVRVRAYQLDSTGTKVYGKYSSVARIK